ncbi:uncharacterized protein LOC127205174 [Acomys russatus]|uniref:uncharacterized protein LOC127205174 n=1 Tax=Acomys russatus TaxID=60746 RepID=UPI0021E2B53A|nr:uncharacterized protein LOC127205174 [Acomys russatus]
MSQILRDHLKNGKGKKHRDSRAQEEDKRKAARQILPEQAQSEAQSSASPPKASTRFPQRSNAYLIIGLQNKLAKCSLLKTVSDYENFWKLVQEEALGVEMKEKLQKIKFKCLHISPPSPPLLGIFCYFRKQQVSLLSRLTEWRKRCQQREAARRLQRGPQESKTMCKTKTDSRGKLYLSRLNRMYSTSLANMEFSRSAFSLLFFKPIRIITETAGPGGEADLGQAATSGRIFNLRLTAQDVDYMVPSRQAQAAAPPRETGLRNSLDPGQQPRVPPALRFLKCQSPGSPQTSWRLKTGRHQGTLSGMSKLSEHVRGTLAPAQMTTEHVRAKPAPTGVTTGLRPAVPLTLEHVIQTHPVVEVKTPSRYWVNYVDEEKDFL